MRPPLLASYPGRVAEAASGGAKEQARSSQGRRRPGRGALGLLALLIVATGLLGAVARSGAGLLRLPAHGLRLPSVGWPTGPLSLRLAVIEPEGATAWMVLDRREGDATWFACRVELGTGRALACHRIPRASSAVDVHFAYQEGRMLLAYVPGPGVRAESTHLVLLRGNDLVASAPLAPAATEGLGVALLLGLLHDRESRQFELWLYGRRGDPLQGRDEGHRREARRIVVGYDGGQGAPTTTALPEEPPDLVPEAVAATSPRTIFCRSDTRLLALRADRIEPIEGLGPCQPAEPCLLPLERLGYDPGPRLRHVKALVEPDGTLTALGGLPGLEHVNEEGTSHHAVVSLEPGARPSFARRSPLDVSSVELKAAGGGEVSFAAVPHLFTLLLQARRGTGPAIPVPMT